MSVAKNPNIQNFDIDSSSYSSIIPQNPILRTQHNFSGIKVPIIKIYVFNLIKSTRDKKSYPHSIRVGDVFDSRTHQCLSIPTFSKHSL